MKLLINLYLLLFTSLIVIGCSDLQTNIPQPTELNIHQLGVLDSANANFHGLILKSNNLKLSDCKKCHDANFNGGVTGIKCTGCHAGITVHVDGINDTTSNSFHGKYLGKFNMKLLQCAQCHGETYSGGKSSPSCTTCHSTISVHKSGIIDNSSPNFHAKFIKNLKWDMTSCKKCHGLNYSGSLSSSTCLSSGCHVNPGGPEACNTCHGDFAIPTQISPPRAVNGQTNTDYRGVGAHSNHLTNTVIGKAVSCSVCHSVPTTLNSPGHLDSTPNAEIQFTGLAIFKTMSTPMYDGVNVTCNNTYCHGNFAFLKDSSSNQYAYTADKMEGNNKKVTWTKVNQGEAACGTCHGLPPKGHIGFGAFTISSCANCHGSVVDNTGRIINKSKHINGLVDLN